MKKLLVFALVFVLAFASCVPEPTPVQTDKVYFITFYQQGLVIDYFNTYSLPFLTMESCGSGFTCRVYKMYDTDGKLHTVYDQDNVAYKYLEIQKGE